MIFGLELLALAAFSEDFAPFLAGRSVWIYMGSNNCLSAVTMGRSNAEAIAILVDILWGAIQKYRISALFLVFVRKNPADLPTMDKALPLPDRRKASFESLADLYRMVMMEIRKKTAEYP